jgi:hypothetical protein
MSTNAPTPVGVATNRVAAEVMAVGVRATRAEVAIPRAGAMTNHARAKVKLHLRKIDMFPFGGQLLSRL